MSTIEIKNRIHSLVDTINDNELLKAILTLLDKSNDTGDWWNDLSETEKQSIEKGITQADSNQFVASKEVRSRIDKIFIDNA